MGSLLDDFNEFWARYPKKRAKMDAFKAYGKARSMASAEDILEGVGNLLQHLPDDIAYCKHPASWLRAGCWEDDYTEPVKKPQPSSFKAYVPFRLRKEA